MSALRGGTHSKTSSAQAGTHGKKSENKPRTLDPEEIRRRAREEWLAKYGPGRKI